MITTSPRLTFAIGDHSQGGRGVAIVNAAYAESSVSMRHVEMIASDIKEAVALARSLNVAGFGITMPFKQTVIPLLDEVDDDVQAMGSCNCVVVRDGKLIGVNTDYYGAMTALDEVIDSTSLRSAVIVGAGGVARPLVYALRERGMKIFVAARRREQAEALVERFGLAGALSLDEQGKADADLVVNATSDASSLGPVRLELHNKAKALVDVVVTSLETDLTDQAKQRGLVVVPGWRMLLHLGTRHVELWSGYKAPVEVMEKALREVLPKKTPTYSS